MFELFRPRLPSALLPGDVVFDVLLVITTVGGVWLWVHDPIAKINAEFALVCINGIAIYFYHRHLKDLPLDSFRQWSLSLLGSSVLVLIASGFDPKWWDFAVLFVSGQQEKAMRLSDTQLHLNLLMITGLSAIYLSLTGLIRLALKRLFKILYPGDSTLRTREGQ